MPTWSFPGKIGRLQKCQRSTRGAKSQGSSCCLPVWNEPDVLPLLVARASLPVASFLGGPARAVAVESLQAAPGHAAVREETYLVESTRAAVGVSVTSAEEVEDAAPAAAEGWSLSTASLLKPSHICA